MEYFTNGFSFKRNNFNLVTFNIFKDLVIINRSFRVKIIFHEDEDVFKDAPWQTLDEQFIIRVEVGCEK